MASGAPKESSPRASPTEEAQVFLDGFLRDFPAPPGPETPLPWKAPCAVLSHEEVQGELAELALSFLGSRSTPPALASALAHAAISRLLQTDLSEFENPPVTEDEDGGEEEDKLPDSVDRAYFAVFDGHGGVDAAKFASVHVHTNAARQLGLATDPAGTLREAFRLTDEMFLRRAKRERLQSGTTGVCALIAGGTLHIAWLGDSQVILVQQGQVVELMDAHRPERQDEKERIEALGGFVSHMDCWRVNGTLAVSRAIGDIFQKPYVSSEADAASRELTGSEDYLLLACDGFFDFVSPEDAMGLVHNHLARHQGSGLHVAKELVAAAQEQGSRDNITVLVVFLRDPQDVLKAGPLEAGAVHSEPSELNGAKKLGGAGPALPTLPCDSAPPLP
ncbi:protein phosphatase 1F [Echinops telfairi]|uniref:Protein phosphatase 1F n=1 Tax=Echinops telfairi TaxID=9371 RepID=A0ABM0ZTN9_ECHTE|nr:protein phosphatase 1F [Echinops telfairi]